VPAFTPDGPEPWELGQSIPVAIEPFGPGAAEPRACALRALRTLGVATDAWVLHHTVFGQPRFRRRATARKPTPHPPGATRAGLLRCARNDVWRVHEIQRDQGGDTASRSAGVSPASGRSPANDRTAVPDAGETPALREAARSFCCYGNRTTVRWTPRTGVRPVVSFTHDGSMRLGAVAFREDVIGLGIDVVDLCRFARYDRDEKLRDRLAERLFGTSEDRSLAARGSDVPDAHLLALAFSMKEAVSKALGTGLRLGLGMGGGHGLPLADIGVALCRGGDGSDETDVALVRRAARRLRQIGGQRVEGRWAMRETHVLTLAIVLA